MHRALLVVVGATLASLRRFGVMVIPRRWLHLPLLGRFRNHEDGRVHPDPVEEKVHPLKADAAKRTSLHHLRVVQRSELDGDAGGNREQQVHNESSLNTYCVREAS